MALTTITADLMNVLAPRAALRRLVLWALAGELETLADRASVQTLRRELTELDDDVDTRVESAVSTCERDMTEEIESQVSSALDDMRDEQERNMDRAIETAVDNAVETAIDDHFRDHEYATEDHSHPELEEVENLTDGLEAVRVRLEALEARLAASEPPPDAALGRAIAVRAETPVTAPRLRLETLDGYDRVASAGCDYGEVVVLNNNGTHYLLVETSPDEPGGTQVAAFPYRPGTTVAAYEAALAAMAQKALSFTGEPEDSVDRAERALGVE